VKIRVDVSSLATSHISGVGNYTRLLTEALATAPNTELTGHYFNFMGRQPTPKINLKNALEQNRLIPLRVYAKLQSFNIAPPFDLFLQKADVTIFPNFATWPTTHSGLRATVIHDLTYLYFPEVVETKNLAHLRRVVPRSIKTADFIITVSETVKQELVREFKMDPARCIVTPIPPDSSYSVKNTNEIHAKYGIPTEKYIFFIGNLEPRKDLPTLINAYRQLPAAMKAEYSLVLAGGKGWKTEASQAALSTAQQAGEKVVHVGYIDQADAGAFYQQAAVFVMPSLYEGFGMPILEALASHTPVIASDIPVLKETGGEAVLYAKAGDARDFSKKITILLTDEPLRAQLKIKANEQLARFSWDKNRDSIYMHIAKLRS
jgi:glycosyltransferase involved in cell wall biosynthesis